MELTNNELFASFGNCCSRAGIGAAQQLGGIPFHLIWVPAYHFGGNAGIYILSYFPCMNCPQQFWKLWTAGAAGVLAKDAESSVFPPLLNRVLLNSALNLLPVWVICSCFGNMKIRICRHLLSAFCSISAANKLNPSWSKVCQAQTPHWSLWPFHKQHLPWRIGTKATIRFQTSYVASLLFETQTDFWKGRS